MGDLQETMRTGTTVLRGLPRLFDKRPIWAALNITNKCNLSCGYCDEYDNSQPHVEETALRQRIDKCASLGTRYVSLLGGEPLLHPKMIDLVQHITDRGMLSGTTTNGFLLSEERLRALKRAGLMYMQISVDSLTASGTTRKSLDRLFEKIVLLKESGIRSAVVSSVLCEETIDEIDGVLDCCDALGVSFNFLLVHDGSGRISYRDDRVLEKVEWFKRQKQRGRKVVTPYSIMDYYLRSLKGQPMRWVCSAGCKYFYVSPDGELRYCSRKGTGEDLLTLSSADLARHRDSEKGCEPDCGITCVVQTSMLVDHPAFLLKSELLNRSRARPWAGRPARQRTLPVLRPYE